MVRNDRGALLHGLLFSSAADRGTALVSGGNTMSREQVLYYYRFLLGRGFRVLAFSFQGFDDNEGGADSARGRHGSPSDERVEPISFCTAVTASPGSAERGFGKHLCRPSTGSPEVTWQALFAPPSPRCLRRRVTSAASGQRCPCGEGQPRLAGVSLGPVQAAFGLKPFENQQVSLAWVLGSNPLGTI
jgi:hypothetical protein